MYRPGIISREHQFSLAFEAYAKAKLCLSVDKPTFETTTYSVECDLILADLHKLYKSREGLMLTNDELITIEAVVSYLERLQGEYIVKKKQ